MIVQNALDARDAGRASSCCGSRSARSCSRRSRSGAGSAGRASTRRAGATSCSRALAFGVDRVRRLLVPERGPATHDHVELRVHHRACSSCSRRSSRRSVTRRRPDRRRADRGRRVGGRAVPAHRRDARRSAPGDALTLGVRGHVRRVDLPRRRTFSQRFDPVALTAGQMVGVRRAARCRSCAIGGLGHVTGAGRARRGCVTGRVLQRARVHAAALGAALRRAEPRRGDPAVRAGRRRVRRLSRSASGSGVTGYVGAVVIFARHRDRRVAVVAPAEPRPSLTDRLLDRAVKRRDENASR